MFDTAQSPLCRRAPNDELGAIARPVRILGLLRARERTVDADIALSRVRRSGRVDVFKQAAASIT